jgi:hypothetical protein
MPKKLFNDGQTDGQPKTIVKNLTEQIILLLKKEILFGIFIEQRPLISCFNNTKREKAIR